MKSPRGFETCRRHSYNKNQRDTLISEIYFFWNKILHVSDSNSVHHQEIFTVHTAMAYVIQILLTACEQDQDGTLKNS